MARIAFAWEMGGELGHVVACSGLARALATRGHTIAMVLRELRGLSFIPETRAYDIFQAPRSVREAVGAGVPVSFADILLGCGYANPEELAALLGGWRSVFSEWKPDLLIADFAPTALLAARSLGLARASFGNGFFTPPRLSPIPPFRVDVPPDAARVGQAEARALEAVNRALAILHEPPLARLADVFATDEDFLCTFPELDHYGTRPHSGYWGPRLRFDLGAETPWPQGPGRKLFVYVKRFLPQLDALLAHLAASPYRILAFIPDLDEARRARLRSRMRVVSERPVRLDAVIRQCDLMICHGGEIATGALMHGVPQLLFPSHYEQYLTARRLEQVGSGRWLSHQATGEDIAATIDAMLPDPRYALRAKEFAARYPAFSPAEQRRRIVLRIEELAAKAILSASPTPQEDAR
jgi:hypothetical protein